MSCSAAQFEHRHHPRKPPCLLLHGQGCSAGFFNQRRVLLRHLIEIAHCLIDLVDAVTLLGR